MKVVGTYMLLFLKRRKILIIKSNKRKIKFIYEITWGFKTKTF